MDGINPENAVLANLIFGIGDIKAQMEAVETMARETALRSQQAFQNVNLISPTNTSQMTAQQAMVNQIAADGSARRVALEAESASKIDAIAQKSALMLKKGYSEIDIAVSESATKQVLAREKADAAIVESAAMTQAKVEEIQSRAGINNAKAQGVSSKTAMALETGFAEIDALGAKTVANIEMTEAKKAAIVAQGEAKVSETVAKEELTRQKIVRESANTQLAIVRQQVEQEKLAYMQARKAAFEDQPTGVLGLAQRHMSWSMVGLATGTALFGTFELLKGAIVDVSGSMAKLKQVLEIVPPYDKSPEKLTKDLNELKEVAGLMAATYGIEFSKVLDVMSQAGRRFKDVASIISATDTALQLVVVDAVPVEMSIASIEALMSQFGLSTGQAKKALYEISAAAHMLQVTAPNLLQAIQRSGSAFKTMKANTEEAVAAISVLSQMTAQQGGMIGNAWKSLEASLASDRGQKALKELGLELFDSNGKIKDMSELLVGLQEKWHTLSDKAKMHYAQVLAGGRFHYQRLQAFLDDYTGAYKKALAGIKTANADMQNQLVASAMESLPRQWDITTAKMEVFANKLAGDVTPALISFLMSVRSGIGIIEDHKEELGRIISTGVKLVEAYATWKIALWAYNGVVKSTVIQNVALQGGLLKLELMGKGLPRTMAAIAGAVGAVGVAAATAAMKLVALTAAFGVLSKWKTDYEDPVQGKLDDLNAKIADKELLLKYRPGASLGTSVDLLWKGQLESSASQLDQAIFGWMGSNSNRDKEIKSELNKAKEQRDSYALLKKRQEEANMKKDLEEYQKLMEQYEKDAEEKTKNILKDQGEGDNSLLPGGGGGSAAAQKSFAELLEKRIKLIEAAATAQGKLNALTQRDIDFQQTQSQFHMEHAMSMQEYIEGLNQQSALTAQYEKQQEGVHKEAEFYRAALVALQEAQAGVNTSTDEGQEAYDKIGEEMDNVQQKIDNLSTSWWDIEGQQRSLYGQNIKGMIDTLKSMKEVGVDTNEGILKMFANADWSKLQMQEQLDLLKDFQEVVKELADEKQKKIIDNLNDQKEASKAASEARIAAIQAEIDALSEEADKESELKEIEEARQSIAEAESGLSDAQTKLSNVQKERNTRIFQDGRWQYIADPEAVRNAQKEVKDAQEKLLEAQKSYNEKLRDIDREHRKKELQDQIQAEKDSEQKRQNHYDLLAKIANESYEKMAQDILKKGPLFASAINDLFENALDKTLVERLEKQLATTRDYATRMAEAIQNAANGETPTASTTPSGTTTNASDSIIAPNSNSLRLPNVRNIGAGDVVRTSSTTNTTVDGGVKLYGNMVFSNVHDLQGFLRAFRQMAVAGS